MLDEKLKQAYQKIIPSPELEDKVLHLQPIRQSSRVGMLSMRRAAALAACMILLVGVLILMRSHRMEILLPDGSVLSERAMPFDPQYPNAMAARTVSGNDITSYALNEDMVEAAIPLTFSCKGKLSLSVEVGTLMICYLDDNCDGYVEAGQAAEDLDGDTSVYWVIPITDEDAVYNMTVNRRHIVRVTYDAQQNEYTISHIVGNS